MVESKERKRDEFNSMAIVSCTRTAILYNIMINYYYCCDEVHKEIVVSCSYTFYSIRAFHSSPFCVLSTNELFYRSTALSLPIKTRGMVKFRCMHWTNQNKNRNNNRKMNELATSAKMKWANDLFWPFRPIIICHGWPTEKKRQMFPKIRQSTSRLSVIVSIALMTVINEGHEKAINRPQRDNKPIDGNLFVITQWKVVPKMFNKTPVCWFAAH